MTWCFVKLNNRLAEIYFKHDKGGKPVILGHCYVDDVTNWTSEEKRYIKEDTKRYAFSYYRGRYRDKLRGLDLPLPRKSDLKSPFSTG